MEHIDIIDEQDSVMRVATRDEVYRSKLSHRIVHVLVLHPQTNHVYLQVRGPHKDYLPNYYCTSAGGHVLAGEDYEQAAKRELREEIGIDAPLQHISTFSYTHVGIPIRIALFIAEAADGFDFMDGEVAEGRFVSMEETKKLIAKGELIHPQLAVCFEKFLVSKFAA